MTPAQRIKRFLARRWIPLWPLVAFACFAIDRSGILGLPEYDHGGVGTFLFCFCNIIALPLAPAVNLFMHFGYATEAAFGMSLVVTLPLAILIQLGINALLDLDQAGD